MNSNLLFTADWHLGNVQDVALLLNMTKVTHPKTRKHHKRYEVKKHFVELYYPGLFFSNSETLPIHRWSVAEAIRLIAQTCKINPPMNTAMHRPYAFTFMTKGRAASDLDSKVIARSGCFYLGGKISTLAEVEARKDPQDRTLIENMKCNKIPRIIESRGKTTVRPFTDKDVLLDNPFIDQGEQK